MVAIKQVDSTTGRALYCIRPQFFEKKKEIELALAKAGLEISHSKTVWLTEKDLFSLYANEAPSPYIEATKFYMTRGFCQIGIVCGKNVVRRLVEATGLSHIPLRNNIGTIRARFGSRLPIVFQETPYYLNPIHRSSNKKEAVMSTHYFLSQIENRSRECTIADMMFQLHLDRNLLSVYNHHIKKVVEIAGTLCGEFGGNETVVRVASWLHDIVALKTGTKKDHHIAGAQEAGKILRTLEYGEDIIKSVQHCIECHSGSAPQSSRTIEAEIVRSADGIANLKYPPLLFFFAFAKKGLDFDKGMDSVKRKVESSFSKISDFAKHKAQDDYERWIKVLS